jgi:hypothetical protein
MVGADMAASRTREHVPHYMEANQGAELGKDRTQVP